MVRTASLQRSERRSCVDRRVSSAALPALAPARTASSRTERWPGLVEQRALGFGRRRLGDRSQLVEADVAGLQCPDQLRDVPCLLRHTDQGASRRRRDLEALRRPGGGGRCAVVVVGASPLGLAEQLDDVSLETARSRNKSSRRAPSCALDIAAITLLPIGGSDSTASGAVSIRVIVGRMVAVARAKFPSVRGAVRPVPSWRLDRPAPFGRRSAAAPHSPGDQGMPSASARRTSSCPEWPTAPRIADLDPATVRFQPRAGFPKGWS